jgi:ElaB/YqjD/DUF883 family membrane-anchored ribosome-binding protein
MSSTERVYRSTTDKMTDSATDTLRNAKAGLDGVVEDVGEKGREALRGARDVADTFADALIHSIRARPYTTLAIAGLAGFAYGAMRRR